MCTVIRVMTSCAFSHFSVLIVFWCFTHIECISLENIEPGMPTSPPQNTSQKAQSLLDSKYWKNDDWIMKKSTQSTRTAVLDKRWEDFDVIKMKNYQLNASTTSFSFSVYGTNKINFMIAEGLRARSNWDTHIEFINNTEMWTTFTIFSKGGHVYYFKNNEECFKEYPYPYLLLEVSTPNSAYFKIHEYEYKEADIKNAKENPTILTIPNVTKSSYLIVYVSLCKSCDLGVKTSEEDLFIYSEIKETDLLEHWRAYRINLNSYNSNEVKFIRGQNSSTETGYWKLDVRLYNEENNAVRTKTQNTTPYATLPSDSRISTDVTSSPIGVSSFFPSFYEVFFMVPPTTNGSTELRNLNHPTEEFLVCVLDLYFNYSSNCKLKQNYDLLLLNLLDQFREKTPADVTTLPTIQRLNDTQSFHEIKFVNLQPPSSNQSHKASFVLSESNFVSSSAEIIAYGIFLFKKFVTLNNTGGYWNGTTGTWPPWPNDSLQITPPNWNPFNGKIHTCDFILGTENSCCEKYCNNERLEPNTKYWLMVRALTRTTYNDSLLLDFETGSTIVSGFNILYVILIILLAVLLALLILFKVHVTFERRYR